MMVVMVMMIVAAAAVMTMVVMMFMMVIVTATIAVVAVVVMVVTACNRRPAVFVEYHTHFIYDEDLLFFTCCLVDGFHQHIHHIMFSLFRYVMNDLSYIIHI